MSHRPHARRATRETIHRALIILCALQQDDLPRADLIARVTQELGETAYGDAPEDAFLRDIKWLHVLGFEVAWMPDAGSYHLQAGDNPLVRLKLTAEFRTKFIQLEVEGWYQHTTAPVDQSVWRPVGFASADSARWARGAQRGWERRKSSRVWNWI